MAELMEQYPAGLVVVANIGVWYNRYVEHICCCYVVMSLL